MTQFFKKNLLRACILIALGPLMIFSSGGSSALGSAFTLRFGPPSAGNGGPNPLSIPPSGADVEASYVAKSGFETSLSVSPGILFGYRTNAGPGPYVSLGGGFVIDANGVGPGIYAGFGGDFWCGWVCFSAEVKQALGISEKHIVSPYALRVGASIRW